MLPTSNDNGHPLADRFRRHIRQTRFPCVGAKSALARGRMEIMVARDIGSSWDDLRIYQALFNFARAYRRRPRPYQSFVVIFDARRPLSDIAFERLLWTRLQSLTDKDAWHGQHHARGLSDDPVDPRFALSFAGEGFFVVGLHPGAGRRSRRFDRPVLVFNPHDQFETLRREGVYEKLRAKILARDLALSGSENPMLARHGEASGARQYSGRVVEDTWTCPFHRPAGPTSLAA